MENHSPTIQKLTAAAKGPERKSVMLDLATHQQLDKAAKKLDITNGEYTSAAIAYFAETGLNPTAERPAGLADVNSKVSIETRAVRVQNADIGNRLIGIMRGWEKSLYGFLQQQQAGTLNYLEQIENNILRHQVSVETSFLSPMIELMVKTNVETYMGRIVGEKTNLQVMGKPQSDWVDNHKVLNDRRDLAVVDDLSDFIQANSAPAPGRAPKPVVPQVPDSVPTLASTAVTTTGVAPK